MLRAAARITCHQEVSSTPNRIAPIDVVMHDQADLVRVEHEFTALANYKGVERMRSKGGR